MKNQEAKRILSIGVAILLLFHGVHNATYGVDAIIEILETQDIPFAKYLVYALFLSELIAPILLLCNRLVNIAGTLIVINISVTISIVHIDHLLEITKYGVWGVEVPILYLIIGATLALWENETTLN